MGDQQQRRVRLRLARQSTAPARVRARVRDDQQSPDPETETRKRIPWVHIGTVAGAVAAIGSLTFTGVATYYGAVVAQQQLDQARGDDEKQVRDQAARVTFWGDHPFSPTGLTRGEPFV